MNTSCDYCEEPMDWRKMYVVMLSWTGNYETSLRAYGHKGCGAILSSYYRRYGRIVTAKEAEAMAFDPGI